jgi:hypothetical protein
MYLLSNALNGTGCGCKIKGPKVDTYYGPCALYGWPKDLCRDPKTTQSTDQHSWTLYIKHKNEIWSGQILDI